MQILTHVILTIELLKKGVEPIFLLLFLFHLTLFVL